MSDLIRLATRLRDLPAEQLASILVQGNFLENPPHDLFELARSMLTRRQLEPKIRKLSQADLQKLQLGKSSKLLTELNLADRKASYLAASELCAQLEPAKNKRPEQGDKNFASNALASYETLLAITEFLFATERHWLRYMKSGLRAPDAKWLSERLQLEPKEIQNRFSLAIHAGLITAESDRWLFTESGQNWLELEAEARWQKLAEAIMDLPAEFVIEPGSDLFESLLEQFPLLETAELAFLNFGAALSLIENGKLTDLGALALKSVSRAAKSLAKELPKPAKKLIVQADLSITSPGPLSTELHRELDYFCESEDLGIAARFRISSLSVTHALEVGKTISEIENFLVKHSGNPLPQPVKYLLVETQNKLGSLVVQQDNGGSSVLSKDEILLLQIQNEPALSSLGLKKTEQKLFSFVEPEVLYFNLREVGYPVLLLDTNGEIVNPRHPAVRTSKPSNLISLETAEKLLKSEAVEVAGDEKLRQLQFAMKNKMKVFVKIEIPNQGIVDLELEPLGIAGNRLRGRDVVRQAERTLPLSAVRSIQLG